MNLTCLQFPNGGEIPVEYTCDGANRSPAFAWSDVPAQAQGLLLLCYDPDAPSGTFHHWAVFDIPPHWPGLKAGFGVVAPVPGLRQAVNDFGVPGYAGPCPPRSHATHHYHFRLSALSSRLDVAATARCGEVRHFAGPLEIASAEVIGLYRRR